LFEGRPERGIRDVRPLYECPNLRAVGSEACSRVGQADQEGAVRPGELDILLPACVDMLAPIAAATGLTVRREPNLTRAEFLGNEQRIADRLLMDAVSNETLVVCGQQQVISGLLAALGRRSVVRPPHETTVKKGGWWLLHHRDGAISSYERHEPAA